MQRYLLCLAACLLTLPALAQTKNPVSSVIKEILPRQTKNIEAAIDSMPADKFTYRPTDGQMTFGHLAVHIAESNYLLCAKASDTPAPKTEELKETDSKDKLSAAVKASFDYCNTALAKTDDSKLGIRSRHSADARPHGLSPSSHSPAVGPITTRPPRSICV
jgi:hypothetical protein